MPHPSVQLTDTFWAPRLAQLRDVTLPALLERLEAHGVVENFRRLRRPDPPPRDASWLGAWVSDSDLYKWTEAAVLAARGDLADPVIAAVVAAQDPDGYLHTFYGHDGMGRYFDPDTGHELYCMGHCIEAAVSHHEATGSRTLLDAAIRIGQHVVGRFGPGRDERVDLHPEMELALCRLAAVTGDRRLVEHARWMIEQTLGRAGLTLETFAPGGHAVRFLYLASGIAEVAAATGDARWRAAALRLWSDVVERHGYCTGAVGGRWMGEAIGRPYELDDETSYAESCAAVAMAHFTRRIWRLGGDPACLEHLDMLLFNALPAGVGADGASWCYANALAFTDAPERNPWVLPFEYGSAMALKWFPPRRHEWFDVMCCPPNLARAFAQVSSWVCQEDGTTLRILLPLACRITTDAWDVAVDSDWPWSGDVAVRVQRAPQGGRLLLRRPGEGFDAIATTGSTRTTIPVRPGWWSARPEVGAMAGKVFLRRGPVVYALDDRELPGIDLRRVTIDPSLPVDDRDPRAIRVSARIVETGSPLYRPAGEVRGVAPAVDVVMRPYHAWPTGIGQLRLWLGRP
jgi:DUF1680 family protein